MVNKAKILAITLAGPALCGCNQATQSQADSYEQLLLINRVNLLEAKLDQLQKRMPDAATAQWAPIYYVVPHSTSVSDAAPLYYNMRAGQWSEAIPTPAHDYVVDDEAVIRTTCWIDKDVLSFSTTNDRPVVVGRDEEDGSCTISNSY